MPQTNLIKNITKQKYQVFGTSASRNTAGVFSTGTANNLEIGKTYKVFAYFYTNLGGGAAITCDIKNGATVLRNVSFETQGTIGADKMPGYVCEIFVATSTTLTANLITINASQSAQLYMMSIEEWTNPEITTQWT